MVLLDQVNGHSEAFMWKTLFHHRALKRGIEKTVVTIKLKSFSYTLYTLPSCNEQFTSWKIFTHTSAPDCISHISQSNIPAGLLQKAQSNSPSSIKTTTTSAFQTYSDTQDASSALKTLSTLPGIGPATASLLLSIHSPSNIPFFSDECFLWLCRSGAKSTIKYNAKEYGELLTAAAEVMERLGVQAVDVEKVAFALMRYNCSEPIVAAENDTASTTRQEKETASEAAPLKHTAEDLQSGAAKISRQESTEDQKPEKTRVGEVEEVRADDANRLKRAASNAGTGTPRKRKLEAAETTGAEGNMNSAALEVLKK